VVETTAPDGDCTTSSMLTRLCRGLSFKHPLASYTVGWRIMLTTQHILSSWSESEERIISKRFGEGISLELFWNDIVDQSMLDSQTKLVQHQINLLKL